MDSEFEKRLDALGDKLEEIEARKKPKIQPSKDHNMTAVGLRLSIEFVAATGVGAFLGIMLDKWLGTTALFTVIFIILGLAAGFMSIYKVSRNYGTTVGFANADKKENE